MGTVFRIIGSLALFLYGMKIMSEGIQKAAGSKMRRVLALMTGSRLSGIITGCAVTAIIQSSSATTVMAVSFVNAGILTLTQSIGVIMGANIGTTITAWVVSLMRFSFSVSALALPAVGLGFIVSTVKSKNQSLGEVLLGFGILFLGLDFLTKSMPPVSADNLRFMASLADLGALSILAGTGIGFAVTVIVHSSSASTAIILTLAHGGLVTYEMAGAMILGANIGTTIDAALAAIGTKTAARQAALVHILFNVIGTVFALALFRPLMALVDLVAPGSVKDSVTAHLAMLHTVFNVMNTVLFFPFVKPFAKLVSLLVKDTDKTAEASDGAPYKLVYRSGSMRDTPELNIPRAEKEIRDMAALAAAMYAQIKAALEAPQTDPARESAAQALVEELARQEERADQMREELMQFLIACTRTRLSSESEARVSKLLRIIVILEEMTDDCYGIGLIFQRSAKKNMVFKRKEMEALTPYLDLVEAFLTFTREHLGSPLAKEETARAEEMENAIDKSRDKLRKLGRKRIEAGQDLKTELVFIDLVRRVEQLGDYCYNIAEIFTQE
ncbi:MAG: Na/Pi cotransporter family protein [Spirochaetaceae bacterium]|jgi:phosphate:Na+ symporter|nr:Na/Pi cotransporter family protein [Spirochaetaceae bacterium]